MSGAPWSDPEHDVLADLHAAVLPVTPEAYMAVEDRWHLAWLRANRERIVAALDSVVAAASPVRPEWLTPLVEPPVPAVKYGGPVPADVAVVEPVRRPARRSPLTSWLLALP